MGLKQDWKLKETVGRYDLFIIVLEELAESMEKADLLDNPKQEALVRGILKITGQNILERACVNYRAPDKDLLR